MVEVVVGGFYKSADGEKVGPMLAYGGLFTVHDDRGRLWHKSGRVISQGYGPDDLIEEWVDEPAAPVSSAPEVEDGKWIAWNGGERPEHPETVVEVVFTNIHGNTIKDIRFAGTHRWEDSTHAYRVIKRHVEPKKAREFWTYGRDLFDSKELAVKKKYDDFCKGIIWQCSEIIHVREVIEPEIDQAVK